MYKKEYMNFVNRSQTERMLWWKKAKFGMFVHYGLYSVKGDHEWSKGNQNIPKEEYNKLSDKFTPNESNIEQWVKLAKESGMKYIVLTTRHHEGFSLWDSKVNKFNSMNYGSNIDVVETFIKYCRKYEIKIGLYFSLMDWEHPDASSSAYDLKSRDNFLKYIKGMLKELLTNYGEIDILWYDIPRPMESYEGWDSVNMNRMVRKYQPNVIINNRSRLPEDFGTPEEKIVASDGYWEACMTMNGLSWGYLNSEFAKYYNYSEHQIIKMLGETVSKGGNLLLNISPNASGEINNETISTLTKVGKWLKVNGEAVYGDKTKTKIYRTNDLCISTENQNISYIWNLIWPSSNKLRLGGKFSAVQKVILLQDNLEIKFYQDEYGIDLFLDDLKPSRDFLGISVFKIVFKDKINYSRSTRYPQLLQGNDFDM